MNTSDEMTREEVLRAELDVLREEHRDLDTAIAALEGESRPDRFAIMRLKKRKLRLKDRIGVIEDELFPDIIA